MYQGSDREWAALAVCLVVLCVLAVIGLGAVAYGVMWLIENVHVVVGSQGAPAGAP